MCYLLFFNQRHLYECKLESRRVSFSTIASYFSAEDCTQIQLNFLSFVAPDPAARISELQIAAKIIIIVHSANLKIQVIWVGLNHALF